MIPEWWLLPTTTDQCSYSSLCSSASKNGYYAEWTVPHVNISPHHRRRMARGAQGGGGAADPPRIFSNSHFWAQNFREYLGKTTWFTRKKGENYSGTRLWPPWTKLVPIRFVSPVAQSLSSLMACTVAAILSSCPGRLHSGQESVIDARALLVLERVLKKGEI